MVLDEMRKLRLIEKVVRGRQITDRMHEIPKKNIYTVADKYSRSGNYDAECEQPEQKTS